MPRIDTADCTVRHSRQGNTIGNVYQEHLDLPEAIEIARKGYHRLGGKWDIRVKGTDGKGTRVVESFKPPMWRLGPRTDHQSATNAGGFAWTAFHREIGGLNYRFIRTVSLWNHDAGITVLVFNGKPGFLNPPVRRFHWGAEFRPTA